LTPSLPLPVRGPLALGCHKRHSQVSVKIQADSMWSSNQFLKALESAESRSTASLSNTVCISDPEGQWPVVQLNVVRDLSEFGEIARLDTSLVTVARCILVTFFDVRAAQRVMLSSPGRCEPFPPAAHDCRAVRVNLASFAEKVDHVQGGFNQFGEVANISASSGEAVVEFYDIRSAQMLLGASQGTATPWMPEQKSSMTSLLASLGEASPSLGVDGLLPMQGKIGSKDKASSRVADFDSEPDKTKERSANGPVRTKVSTKEFSKYDIDPEKIQAGQDSRTTVMVRNLSGTTARRDFLLFLDKSGLGDRYSFFYMPCKEHRNIPAGFAFINFISPSDVHNLYVLVKGGMWREFMEASSKAPGMSYARFQGHDELAKHFSSSAVLHEQDSEKRPIFRPEAAAKAAQEKQKLESQKADDRSKKAGAPMRMPNFMNIPKTVASSALGGPPGIGLGGVNDAPLFSSTFEAMTKTSSPPPAYLKAPSMLPTVSQDESQQALQVLLAAKSILDSGYFPPQQMGA